MSMAGRVHVAPRFQRAVRIDADVDDPRALDGFVCPQSAVQTLLTMARHVRETRHCAFTWTGPYGSGKSSLVVVLGALLGADARRRAKATDLFGAKPSAQLEKNMPRLGRGWLMLPVVGRRGSPVDAVGEALVAADLCRRPRGEWTDEKVLQALSEAAADQPRARGGLVLVMDEMGKFLESAASDNSDVYFFQQLADFANRSDGRLVVIGVLHQAFDEYAQRLSRERRDEWSKVQGRYVDLLVDTAAEEQLELLARAIQMEGARPDRTAAVKAVAESIATVRRIDAGKLGSVLQRCLPLHPIVAALLGPMSRRRFGQNQRSVFGFLNSAETHGFQEFLRTCGATDTYDPPRMWDYLRANLEPAILASPDGHRWSVAVEAVDRCEGGEGDRRQIDVIKTIAVVELFRERSGISPTKGLLAAAIPGAKEAEIRAALDTLAQRSLIVFRRHLGAYGVYAGSDFDIEAALDSALASSSAADFAALRALASFQPVVAKRHYHSTGSMRWFDVDILPLSELNGRVEKYRPGKGAMGLLLLPIPSADESLEQMRTQAKEAVRSEDVLVGVSPHAAKVLETAREALAVERVWERPELDHDRVAKREVAGRLAAAQAQLAGVLRQVMDGAVWHRKGAKERSYSVAELSALASDLADAKYGQAPKLFNEMLMQVAPSANANTAKNALLKAMVSKEGTERLGLVGFPAEAGLFMSLLEKPALYRRVGKTWKFIVPGKDDGDESRLKPLWDFTDEYLRAQGKRTVSLDEIFQEWRKPPFGLKDGVHAVIGLAYALSRRDRLAYYRTNIFQSRWTEIDADYLISDANDLQVRWLEVSSASKRLLEGVRDAVLDVGAEIEQEGESPLDVARSLVAVFDALEPWTKRTGRLEPETLTVRDVLRRASDPNTLLFDELPTLLSSEGAGSDRKRVDEAVGRLKSALSVLKRRYSDMLDELTAILLHELEAERSSNVAEMLRDRAENVAQISGDLRLNAFITHLSRPTAGKIDIEGIAGLAVNKQPRDWTDADLDQAKLEIAAFAQQFVRAEALAAVKGRRPKRHAMAVVVGIDGRKDARSHEFAISDQDRRAVNELVAAVEHAMASATKQRKNVILAALAEISAKYMDDAHEHTSANTATG